MAVGLIFNKRQLRIALHFQARQLTARWRHIIDGFVPGSALSGQCLQWLKIIAIS